MRKKQKMERNMKQKRIYLCENSIDGIFTAIYLAWSSKYGHADIKIQEDCESYFYSDMEFFSEYIQVKTDFSLAGKVARSIRNKISEDSYEMVCRVALSNYPGKADVIYRFLIMGFAIGASVMEQLSSEVVAKMYKINRNVYCETHHFLGFVRFSQQEGNLLSSVIHPKNNILSLIMPHFSDRLPEERFAIIDANRNIAGLHAIGKSWILTSCFAPEQFTSDGILPLEMEYQALWKVFLNSITIEDRFHPKLQRNNLPLRFQNDMTEFNGK
jgi:probable DNA metabolism protein